MVSIARVDSLISPVIRGLRQQTERPLGFCPDAGLLQLLAQDHPEAKLSVPDVAGDYRARINETPILATYGYLATINGLPGVEMDADWRTAIVRLSGREHLPSSRASFFFRPWELFGVALGVKRLAGEADPGWLRDVLDRGRELIAGCSMTHRIAFNLAVRVAGADTYVPIVGRSEVLSTADLAKMLWAQEKLGNELCSLMPYGEGHGILLDRLIRDGVCVEDSVEAAFVFVALDSVIRRIKGEVDSLRSVKNVSMGSQIRFGSGNNVQIIQQGAGIQNNGRD